MRSVMAERRRAQRFERVDQHRIIGTRIRPGHLARIVDVSASGALIETLYRLLPGRFVELQVHTDTQNLRVRGEILRSAVVKVRPSEVCYRGALRFDRHLPWFFDDQPTPVSTPELRPACSMRPVAPPEVI